VLQRQTGRRPAPLATWSISVSRGTPHRPTIFERASLIACAFSLLREKNSLLRRKNSLLHQAGNWRVSPRVVSAFHTLRRWIECPKSPKFPALSLLSREFDCREWFAADCVIRHRVPISGDIPSESPKSPPQQPHLEMRGRGENHVPAMIDNSRRKSPLANSERPFGPDRRSSLSYTISCRRL